MILMIDDDPDDVQLFCSALYETNKPYYCISVPDGAEALQFLDATFIHPEFIFMDLNMPRVNGKECLMQIKKEPKFNGIPVIIYTTSMQKREMEQLYKLGADYFITKPYSPHELMNTITEVLEGKIVKKGELTESI